MKQEELITDFDFTLVAGSTKAAMKEINASSRDLWQVELHELHIIPGFNVRVKNEAYYAHIRMLANSMKKEGFYQNKPLAGYVARVDGQQIIYVTDGHNRIEGAQLAISEGAEIPRVPIVISPNGTSLEDLTVSLIKSNEGKPLTPFEIAVVCKRLIRYGWDTKEIAERLDFTETHVEGLLMLMGAVKEIRDMVQSDQISATTAISAIREHGDKALSYLSSGLENAKASGKERATSKHMPGALFKKTIKKSAPRLFESLTAIKADPGYLGISADLREKLDGILSEIEKTKDNEGSESA